MPSGAARAPGPSATFRSDFVARWSPSWGWFLVDCSLNLLGHCRDHFPSQLDYVPRQMTARRDHRLRPGSQGSWCSERCFECSDWLLTFPAAAFELRSLSKPAVVCPCKHLSPASSGRFHWRVGSADLLALSTALGKSSPSGSFFSTFAAVDLRSLATPFWVFWAPLWAQSSHQEPVITFEARTPGRTEDSWAFGWAHC